MRSSPAEDKDLAEDTEDEHSRGPRAFLVLMSLSQLLSVSCSLCHTEGSLLGFTVFRIIKKCECCCIWVFVKCEPAINKPTLKKNLRIILARSAQETDTKDVNVAFLKSTDSHSRVAIQGATAKLLPLHLVV